MVGVASLWCAFLAEVPQRGADEPCNATATAQNPRLSPHLTQDKTQLMHECKRPLPLGMQQALPRLGYKGRLQGNVLDLGVL
jgi:hypothetical protein